MDVQIGGIMIVAALGVVVYEITTFAAASLGLKMLSGDSLNKRMAGIKTSKKIPVINGILKKQVGKISKRERWISNKAVNALRRATQYEEFKLISVLVSRKVRQHVKETRLVKTGSRIGCAGRISSR
jgi:hypothetical protein